MAESICAQLLPDIPRYAETVTKKTAKRKKKSEPKEERLNEGMEKMEKACFCQPASHAIPASQTDTHRSLFTGSFYTRRLGITHFTSAQEFYVNLMFLWSSVK